MKRGMESASVLRPDRRRRVHPQPSFHHESQSWTITRSSGNSRPLKSAAPSASRDMSSADAVGVAPLYDSDDANVVGESCDVDMGTPTSANTHSLHHWRETQAHEHEAAIEHTGLARWRAANHDTDTIASLGRKEPVVPTTRIGERQQLGSDESADDGAVEIQAFREYSDADIDSLDILPSQDFDNGVHVRPSTHSSPPASSAWHDGTQFDEDASEVFDNIIYAPPLPRRSVARASPLQRATPPPQSVVNDADDQYESESELSDGYEVPFSKQVSTPPPQLPSTPAPTVASSVPSGASSASGTPPPVTAVQWCARMSIKRDCSFIDHTLKHRRKHLSVQDLSESGEEFEEKLKLIDGDDDGDSEDYGTTQPKPRATAASAKVQDTGLLLPGFRPKKKRRKVRQLALDAFLKMQPSASY